MRTHTRPRGRKSKLARFEPLEGRDLLAVVLPSPGGVAPIQVAPIISASPSLPPQVASAQFEPLTGRVLVQFTAEAAGYDPAVLTNPANYRFSLVQSFEKQPTKGQPRVNAGIVLPPTEAITGVTLTSPLEPGVTPSVIVSINNNAPLQFGIYQFTIRSVGLVDRAGQGLDGSYTGTFPSGHSQGRGDFVTLLAEANNTVLPALPTLPPAGSQNPAVALPAYGFYPSTHGIRVRYTAAKPGQFTLAGGNKITLLPLAYQSFPGTYRLPALNASLIHRSRVK